MVFTFFKHFHSKSECFESFTCDYGGDDEIVPL